MKAARPTTKRRGAALMAVLLVMLAVMAIIVVASTTTLNARLIAKNSERSVVLYDAAEAAVEEIRNLVNTHPGDPAFFLDSGEIQLETHVPVKDANGTIIPHVYRTTWAGPSFSTTGEFGIFGTIIAKVEDDYGNVVYHRGTIFQDTFAKYAYFSNNEAGIYFGGGDQIFGPVHSNDFIRIAASGAEFHDKVTTAQTVINKPNGIFDKGVTQKVPVIKMPSTTLLTQLKGLAVVGSTSILGDNVGAQGEATTRIEFLALDLNQDGDSSDDDEGFMRVWQVDAPSTAAKAQYTVAANTGNVNLAGVTNWSTRVNDNCGADTGSATFELVSQAGASLPARRAVLNKVAGRGKCYLGGDPMLNTTGGNKGVFMDSVPSHGAWKKSPMPIDPRLGATGINRADSAYLWPLSHTLNPNFKGVIFVDGKVAISGKVRGRFTLASPYDIVIADDVTLQDNAASDCADYLGLFSGANVVMADNLLNSPQNARILTGYRVAFVCDAGRDRASNDPCARRIRGRELQLRCRAGRVLRRRLGGPRLPLPNGRYHSGNARIGRHAQRRPDPGRVRLHQALRVQHVRTHPTAAVLPYDGPLHGEPHVRNGSGERRHPPVLPHFDAGVARGAVQAAAAAPAGAAWSAAEAGATTAAAGAEAATATAASEAATAAATAAAASEDLARQA